MPAASGRLPGGTAQVTINDRPLPETHSVKCVRLGSLTTITTGNPAGGLTAFVSNKDALTANSVSINDLGGFTGTYQAGLGDKADVTMNDQTYTIRGSADGFVKDDPSQRTTGTFTIRVAC
ncbi:lipoprotein LpqH [Mycobacterium sp. UM_CSW]|uniref:lipoprotein LpqH n=1 Tax=Mycobacterium sp. UM_CSW TaxID=1370119 RepID=UPI0009DB91FF|nr:lipoprotein LpqH [Mycobacterium sp. UM_CSW]